MKILLMLLLILSISAKSSEAVESGEYILHPKNVVELFGRDVLMICSLRDNSFLNWIINDFTIDISSKGISDENLRKKYALVNGSHLLVKSVAVDDAVPYDCHSSNTWAHSCAFISVFLSEPTCTRTIINASGNDSISCSIVYAGKADVGIELTDLQGRALHTDHRKSQPGVTNASFVASNKWGVDSVELKIRFVHNPAELKRCTGAWNVPEMTRTFNLALPIPFENSTKPSMMTEIPESRYLGIENAYYLYFKMITVSVIISVFISVIILKVPWNTAWQKVKSRLHVDRSNGPIPEDGDYKFMNIVPRETEYTMTDLGVDPVVLDKKEFFEVNDALLLSGNGRLEKEAK